MAVNVHVVVRLPGPRPVTVAGAAPPAGLAVTWTEDRDQRLWALTAGSYSQTIDCTCGGSVPRLQPRPRHTPRAPSPSLAHSHTDTQRDTHTIEV
jgi:hypothetical protein